MLNTTTLDTAEAHRGTAYAAERHLRSHGASLCDLHGAFGQPIPDTDAVEVARQDIPRILTDQAPSSLDRIGHERGLSASGMTLRHGARLSELLARFPHAD